VGDLAECVPPRVGATRPPRQRNRRRPIGRARPAHPARCAARAATAPPENSRPHRQSNRPRNAPATRIGKAGSVSSGLGDRRPEILGVVMRRGRRESRPVPRRHSACANTPRRRCGRERRTGTLVQHGSSLLPLYGKSRQAGTYPSSDSAPSPSRSARLVGAGDSSCSRCPEVTRPGTHRVATTRGRRICLGSRRRGSTARAAFGAPLGAPKARSPSRRRDARRSTPRPARDAIGALFHPCAGRLH